MTKLKYLFLFFSAFLLFSCGEVEEIEIRDFKNLNFGGIAGNTAKFSADVLVSNPNRQKIKIKEIDMKILTDDVYLGRMICDEKIIIPSESETYITIPCGLQIANVFSGASIMYKLSNADSVKLELDGTVKAQVLMITKKVKVNRTMMVDPTK